MRNVNELLDGFLSDPEVKAEYDRLAPEYARVEQMLNARKRSGLTQEQVAARMGTTKSAVARLESATHKGSHRSYERYAEAVGHRLVPQFVPLDEVAVGR